MARHTHRFTRADIESGIWLLGPGWLEMPIQLGPGMRSHLHDLQPDPISVERFRMRRQAAACSHLGSPRYAEVLERVAMDVEEVGPAWDVLRGHECDSPG